MQSIRKKSFAAEQLAKRQKKNPWPWIIAGIAVAVVVIGIGYSLLSRYKVKVEPVTEEVIPETEHIKSVAVLPFVDMSPDEDQKYLGDGIADTIISNLTKIRNIRVIDRTSSFEFRGEKNTIDIIGEKLNVDAVLEGSVQKIGDQIRITTQFVRVSDHSHLFSKIYDASFDDIFSIQDEISSSIVEMLEIEVLASERDWLNQITTENVEAFRYFLLASDVENNLGHMEDYLKKAVELDPGFAHAWAGLGYMAMWIENDIQKAKGLLEKALSLQPDLAWAYSILFHINLRIEFDFPSAERNIKKALSLSPGSDWAHRGYADYLRTMGKQEQALRELEQSLDINPRSHQLYQVMMAVYIEMEEYDKALEMFERVQKISPENRWPTLHLGRLHYLTGNFGEAEKAFRKHYTGNNPVVLENNMHMGIIYAMSGNREKAEEVIRILTTDESLPSSNVSIAQIYAALGDNDRAFEWIEKALEKREHPLEFFKVDLEWKNLRSDPRYNEMLKKIGLPVD